MRAALAGLVLVGSLVSLPGTAHADQPVWPTPTPGDIGAWMQAAQSAATAMSSPSCPRVEIAPNVSVPVCPMTFPKPAPGTLPEVALPIPQVLAPAVDLRAMGLDGPVKDQQQTGVCWAFALSSALDSSLRAQGRSDVIAPLHIVASGTFGDVISQRMTESFTVEPSWPYDPVKACKFVPYRDTCESAYGVRSGTWRSDARLVAERESARARGVARIGSLRVIRRDPVQGLVPGVLSALAARHAIYAVVSIDSRAWGWRGIHNGVLDEYVTADRGQHAVTIVGYRSTPDGRQFLLKNSWSTSWGEDGYAWMTEAGLRAHLDDAYLVDASAGFVPSMPSIPTLPSWPMPQVQQAATCPSGLPAVMGQCWLG